MQSSLLAFERCHINRQPSEQGAELLPSKRSAEHNCLGLEPSSRRDLSVQCQTVQRRLVRVGDAGLCNPAFVSLSFLTSIRLQALLLVKTIVNEAMQCARQADAIRLAGNEGKLARGAWDGTSRLQAIEAISAGSQRSK